MVPELTDNARLTGTLINSFLFEPGQQIVTHPKKKSITVRKRCCRQGDVVARMPLIHIYRTSDSSNPYRMDKGQSPSKAQAQEMPIVHQLTLQSQAQGK